MGLIKLALAAAGLSALPTAGNVLKDQWKELFYTDAIPNDTLMVRGKKQTSGSSFNHGGSDNIITNGSGILVADGQCAIIVDQGEIVEVCAETGYFTYDASTEPSIFCGDLKEGLKETWELFKKRYTYGGDTGHDQRIYYFNTKEIVDNKFGTPNPIPFRVVDARIGMDIDVSIRCSGVYSFKMTDPILFYKNVAGNTAGSYTIDNLKDQLKTEFMQALQPAVGQLSALQLRPSDIPAHVGELVTFMNQQLASKWKQLRGMEIISIALNPVTIPEEDAEMIKQAQKASIYKDPAMAAANIAQAQADAMRAAAANEGGAAIGFMGMNMAANAGGMNASDLYQMAGQQAQPKAGTWTCTCGAVNSGNFCSNCGAKRPETAGKVFCTECGAELDPAARFCPNCGKPTGK